MPLRKHVEHLRDTYANEIARAVYRGEQPPANLLESWAKYDAAVRTGSPGDALRPEAASPPEGATPGAELRRPPHG